MEEIDLPEINQLYERLDASGKVVGMERVLHSSLDAEYWMVIHLPFGEEPQACGCDKQKFPFKYHRTEYIADVAAGRFKPAAEDPYADTLVPSKEGTEAKHRQRLEKNWLLIKGIVENPASLFSETRGSLVAQVAEASGRQKTEIYKYCIRYWQRGQVPGSIKPLYHRRNGERQEIEVTGKKRGRKKTGASENDGSDGISIGRGERAKIIKGLKTFHVRGRQPLRAAYRKTLRQFWSRKIIGSAPIDTPLLLPEEQCPTLDQFRYVWNNFKKSHASWVKRNQHDEKDFNLRERLLCGSSDRIVMAPGELFEIDAHRADVELVHHVNLLPVGSPTIYLVVDVFSRLITGVYVTLEQPSYIAAAMALLNAFSPKVEYCQRYGVSIQPSDWPSQHLCKNLLGDRGELLGERADEIEESLGFKIINAPSYRADLKGVIERYFKRLNEKMQHFLPGAIRGPKERGKRNPKLDASLTVWQYTQIVIRIVCQLNREVLRSYVPDRAMIADNLDLTPINLWNWGIRNRSGMLRKANPVTTRPSLYPRADAIITRAGLEYHGLVYSRPPSLSEDWHFAVAAAENKVEIAYDPRLVDTVYLCGNDNLTKGMLPFTLRETYQGFLGCSWREVQEHKKDRIQREAKSSWIELEKQVQDDVVFDRIIRESKLKRDAALGKNVPKSVLTKNVAANREDALRTERQHDRTENDAPQKEQSLQPPSAPKPTSSKIVPFSAEGEISEKANRFQRLFDEA